MNTQGKDVLLEKAFRKEFERVFGSVAVIKLKLHSFAQHMNEHFDMLEFKNGTVKEIADLDYETISKLSEHKSHTVRALVTRCLNENDASKKLSDDNARVRYQAARRAPMNALISEIKKNPSKHEVHLAYQERKQRAKAINEVKKEVTQDLLNNEWYRTTAKNIVLEYGNDVMGGSLRSAVRNTCIAYASMGKFKPSEEKLLHEIEKLTVSKDMISLELKNPQITLKKSLDALQKVANKLEKKKVDEGLRREDLLQMSGKKLVESAKEFYGLTRNEDGSISCNVPMINETDEVVFDKIALAESRRTGLKVNWHFDRYGKQVLLTSSEE